ncbi:MAG: hypothetical protein IPJ01_10620 [Micavibrio sp.]|nr:hypothetical protein [Micavibrio sp.]
MDDLKIFENNALMARFMGAVWVKELECWKDGKSEMRQYLDNADKLKFENTWDWLMCVVDKIEIGLDLGFNVVIKNDKCRIYRYKGSPYEVIVTKLYEGEKFPSTYDAVVEFIKWFNDWANENQKKNL